jgi:hypothetical protein
MLAHEEMEAEEGAEADAEEEEAVPDRKAAAVAPSKKPSRGLLLAGYLFIALGVVALVGVVVLYNYDIWIAGEETNNVGPDQMTYIRLAIAGFVGALVIGLVLLVIGRRKPRPTPAAHAHPHDRVEVPTPEEGEHLAEAGEAAAPEASPEERSGEAEGEEEYEEGAEEEAPDGEDEVSITVGKQYPPVIEDEEVPAFPVTEPAKPPEERAADMKDLFGRGAVEEEGEEVDIDLDFGTEPGEEEEAGAEPKKKAEGAGDGVEEEAGEGDDEDEYSFECPECGMEVGEDDLKCPHCNAEFEE